MGILLSVKGQPVEPPHLSRSRVSATARLALRNLEDGEDGVGDGCGFDGGGDVVDADDVGTGEDGGGVGGDGGVEAFGGGHGRAGLGVAGGGG